MSNDHDQVFFLLLDLYYSTLLRVCLRWNCAIVLIRLFIHGIYTFVTLPFNLQQLIDT